jgi:uncharacterized membrane protein YeiH
MSSAATPLPALLYWLDLFSVAVIAASGALSASRKEMDIGGFALIGVVTGIGGGTVRDLVLGYSPVFWVERPEYLGICLAVAVGVFFVAPHVEQRWKWLLWADAVGLGLYTVVGADKALALGASGLIAAGTGVITATFGGVIRDVLCAEVPLILRKEIYATAAAAGATVYVLLHAAGIGYIVALAIAGGLTFGIRAVAIAYSLSLPAYKGRPGRPF